MGRFETLVMRIVKYLGNEFALEPLERGPGGWYVCMSHCGKAFFCGFSHTPDTELACKDLIDGHFLFDEEKDSRWGLGLASSSYSELEIKLALGGV